MSQLSFHPGQISCWLQSNPLLRKNSVLYLTSNVACDSTLVALVWWYRAGVLLILDSALLDICRHFGQLSLSPRWSHLSTVNKLSTHSALIHSIRRFTHSMALAFLLYSVFATASHGPNSASLQWRLQRVLLLSSCLWSSATLAPLALLSSIKLSSVASKTDDEQQRFRSHTISFWAQAQNVWWCLHKYWLNWLFVFSWFFD